MLTWPPQLDDVKDDLKIDRGDVRDDARLSAALGAAIDLVTRLRGTAYNLTGTTSTLPSPTQDIVLGTVRLAVRWYTRGRSPDGLVANGGELGVSRVPSFDADIDRLLGLGRYRSPVIG